MIARPDIVVDPEFYGLRYDWVVGYRLAADHSHIVFVVKSCNANGCETGETHETSWPVRTLK